MTPSFCIPQKTSWYRASKSGSLTSRQGKRSRRDLASFSLSRRDCFNSSYFHGRDTVYLLSSNWTLLLNSSNTGSTTGDCFSQIPTDSKSQKVFGPASHTSVQNSWWVILTVLSIEFATGTHPDKTQPNTDFWATTLWDKNSISPVINFQYTSRQVVMLFWYQWHCIQVVHILSYQQNTVCFCGRLKLFAFVLEIWCSPRFCPWPHSFTLCSQPVSDRIREHNISYQKFADDTQLHKASQPTEFQYLVSDFESCFLSVKAWMLSNKLKLNDEKTEAMLVGSRQAINLTEAESIQIDGKTFCWIHM